MLFKQHDKSSPLSSTHYAMLYPQNGDRIVTIDFVTSLHPVYSCCIVLTVISNYMQISLTCIENQPIKLKTVSTAGIALHNKKHIIYSVIRYT